MSDKNEIDYTGLYIHIDESWLKIRQLNPTQMMLMVMITGLAKNGMCYASSEYFAGFLHVSENTINNNLKQLEKMGYIRRLNPRSRNRKIIVLASALDQFMRDEYNHKNWDDTEKTTKIGVMENDMTTKIGVNDHKNCDDTPQKLGSIIIEDINSDIIPNQSEFKDYNINSINTVTEEPSAEPDFQSSPEWRQFSKNALNMRLPVAFMNMFRSKHGSNVKVSLSELTNAIKAGTNPVLVLFAAMQVYDQPGILAATIENLGDDCEIPSEVVNEADRIVGRILTDAEKNFLKQIG